MPAKSGLGSAVSVFAVLDAVDADGIGIRAGEPDAPVSDPEAELRRVDSLKFLDAAGVGEYHTLDGGGDTQAGGAVERGQFGFGSIRKDELLQEGSL